MKIKCPKCKEDAELAPDFSYVECKKCGLDMSYGEYVRFVAHNEAKYSDFLGDYTGSTEGEAAGTLDEWEDWMKLIILWINFLQDLINLAIGK